MGSSLLWVKALHIVFVSSWFAGLFYLPRLFLNLASVPADSHAERERLLMMARKLYRFSGLLMVIAIALGVAVGWNAGEVHEQARQVEQAREPAAHEDDVQGLDPQER